MIKNAFSYVKRKFVRSITLFLVILIMAGLAIVSFAIKDGTDKASKETFKNIQNSFTMEINRSYNQGTARGSGNIKGSDIKKIEENENIDSSVKRINSVADLADKKIVSNESLDNNQSAERAKNFSKAVMLTGVNDSAKETKFVSEVYKLLEGSHLNDKDTNKAIISKALADENKLKVGDKLKLKSNIYDPDNEARADEEVEVTIKGIFDAKDGENVTYAQELNANNIITDLNTAAKVYGRSIESANYQDATFFLSGDKNLDKVMDEIKRLDIDFNSYNLIKSSDNYPALNQSISSIYKLADKIFLGSLVFVGIISTLLLFLWINSRSKEIAIYLSLGISKARILGQFIVEVIFISLPAFVLSFFLAKPIASKIADLVLENVTGSINENLANMASSQNLGYSAELESFNKSLTSIDISLDPKYILYVILAMGLVLLGSVIIASLKPLNKNPKNLLIDID